MIDCKDVAGKVVRSLHIFEGGSHGPEVSIDFEDGTIAYTAKREVRSGTVPALETI